MRRLFWSEWCWSNIAAGNITIGEAAKLLRVEILCRRAFDK